MSCTTSMEKNNSTLGNESYLYNFFLNKNLRPPFFNFENIISTYITSLIAVFVVWNLNAGCDS